MGGMAKAVFRVLLALDLFLPGGCASLMALPAQESRAAIVPLGEFKSVAMKGVSLSEAITESETNQQALKKIDEFLLPGMKTVFPDLVFIEPNQEFPAAQGRTLHITPLIQEIRFLHGETTALVKGLIGTSDVLMQVTYRDSLSGNIVAAPKFYRSAGAYKDAGSFGAADARMLEDIAADVVKYSKDNL